MNELFLVVLGIFILSIVVGINRGFIKIVASIFATLIILVLVVAAMPYTSQILAEKTPLKEVIEEKCYEWMPLEDVEIASREMQIQLVEQSELPQLFKDLLLENNNAEVYENLGVTSFVDYMVAYITKLISDIIAFLITFLVVSLIVRVVLYILDIIGHLPVLGGINRLAGGLVGCVTGVLIVWILFIAITILYDTQMGSLFLSNIEESQFLQFLYDHNILMGFVTKFRV